MSHVPRFNAVGKLQCGQHTPGESRDVQLLTCLRDKRAAQRRLTLTSFHHARRGAPQRCRLSRLCFDSCQRRLEQLEQHGETRECGQPPLKRKCAVSRLRSSSARSSSG